MLEYIHNKTYIHADIKGGNLLLDRKSPDCVYLVDFGLASHYTTASEYKLDPKKAHNGTIEYTSRDAHMGGKLYWGSTFGITECRTTDIPEFRILKERKMKLIIQKKKLFKLSKYIIIYKIENLWNFEFSKV